MTDPLSPEAFRLLKKISAKSADPKDFTAEVDKASDELIERGFIQTDGPLVQASAEGLRYLREHPTSEVRVTRRPNGRFVWEIVTAHPNKGIVLRRSWPDHDYETEAEASAAAQEVIDGRSS